MQPLQEDFNVDLNTKHSDQIQLPKNFSVSQAQQKYRAEKLDAASYQYRREDQYNENYLLYRDTVQTNRITMTQAVNIPLIKETGKTILSRINEDPHITLKDKGGNGDKEIVRNKMWEEDSHRNSLDLQDKVEKKQVYLYGRTHTKHNLKNGQWTSEVKDIFDVIVDSKTKPVDIQTARYVFERNIFRPLNEILVSDLYDDSAKDSLKMQFAPVGEDKQQSGAMNSRKSRYQADASQRNERMITLGALPSEVDINGYDQIVELNIQYTMIWDTEKKKYVKYVLTWAEGTILLRAETMMDALGIDMWPFDTWADDLEATDYWSDGVADTLRVINQVVNVWISQLVENRTLRNFGMNYYDATAVDNWTPTGYEAAPGAWYPLPGKPSEVYQKVDVPDLANILGEMQFMISLAEKASATGAIDKGVVEQGKRTLGEIEIAVSKAMERTTAMSTYYRHAQKSRVEKWLMITDANRQAMKYGTLYKTNSQGDLKGKKITVADWYSAEGYLVIVESFDQMLTSKVEDVQRLQAVAQVFPGNVPLQSAIQKRMLGIADLTLDERKDIMEFEKRKTETQQQGTVDVSGTAPGQAPGSVPSGINMNPQQQQTAPNAV